MVGTKKTSKMPAADRAKLVDIRVRGKLGKITPEESLFCEEMLIKYGDEEYDQSISDSEIRRLTDPFPQPSKRRSKSK